MKNKKRFALMLAIVMMISLLAMVLVACGDEKGDTNGSSPSISTGDSKSGDDDETSGGKIDSGSTDRKAKITEIQGGTVEGLTVYLEVDTTISMVDLSGMITTSKDSSWQLYEDVLGQKLIPTKYAAPLFDGNNTYYIVVNSSDGTINRTYTLVIYKNYYVTMSYYVDEKLFDTQKVLARTTLGDFRHPTKDGYTFVSWDCEDVYVTENQYFDARFSANTYNITYNLNGGTNNSGNPSTYTPDNAVTFATPTKTGYEFGGWYANSNFTSKVTSIETGSFGDITLYAKWTPTNYSISYNLVGGSISGTNPTAYTIESNKITLVNPTRTGYTFLGWSGTDITGKSTSVTIPQGSVGNRSYTANWQIITYNIAYNLNGGTNNSSNPSTYNIASSTITLATPTKQYYTFAGWYTNSNFTSKVTSISNGSYGDKTLYAKWTPISYNISYTLNGGSVSGTKPTSYTIESNDITLVNPTRTGYTFLGWSGTDITGKSTSVTIKKGSVGNRSYTANWQIITYNIAYNLYDGTNNSSNPSTYTIESSTITLATPTKTGYTFAGWYSDSGLTSKVTSISKGSYGDKTLYAKWTPISYSISYTLNGGSVSGTKPTSYTIESNDITLVNPTRAYYTFAGWSGTDIEGKSMSVTIPQGSYGNRSYTANWQAIEEMSNFEFTSTSTTCTITGIKDKTATSIVVPVYVTMINQGAFSGCSGLASINVASGNSKYHSAGNCIIETATNTLIAGCKNSVIPDDGSVTSIGSSAFYGCSGLTSITIPDSVTSIGSSAFYRCSGLQSVTIGNSVESIGGSAFSGCSGLTSVTIGNGVPSLPNGLFYGCSSLESITLPFVGGSKTATSVSSSTLFGYIFGESSYTGGTATKQYYSSSSYTTYYIPSTLKNVTITGGKILYGAFYGCSGLTSVTIPDSVTSIGSSAFYGCSSLESITLPFVGGSKTATSASSSTLFGYIFGTSSYTGGTATKQYCSSSYTTYYIPSTLKSVTITGGNILCGAFYGCSGLTSVTIPDSVTSIGLDAFYGCSGLTSITIPDSVTSIGFYAFYGCSGLTSITIPDSVTSIGEWAFSGCSSLESITLPFVGGSKSATSASSSTLFGYIFGTSSYTGGKVTYQYYSSSSATTYYIPSTLKSVTITGGNILYGAFYNCSGLTSITIPDSVTSIGESAFRECSGLTSITIPESVTYIDKSAFYECSGLTSMTIPDSVTSIGKYAFAYCSGLTSVTIGNSVTSIGEGEEAFYGCYKLVEVWNKSSLTITKGSSSNGYVGYYALNVYKEQSGSKLTTDENGFVIYDGNILVSYVGNVTDIIIPNTIKTINQYAFYNCSGLKSVTIPNSVTSIGRYAFYKCSGLTSITIPDSVTSIGSYAFEYCSGLTSVTIGNSVTSIGLNAFYGCSGLTSVTIPDSVTSIGDYAFWECSGLTSITIPDSVTSIGSYAFGSCSGLTSVTIGNSVTSIGSNAFYKCSGLTSITFADTTTWYRTTSSTDWRNKTGGTVTDVTNALTNATNFTSTYYNYYWYKL